MRNYFPFLAVAFLFLLNLPTASFAQDAKIAEVESSLSMPVYIEGEALWTIEERMKHYGVPGVSIAVIHDNEIAWSKTYGVVDKESRIPVKKNTLFQAGSISKPVAAYGALKLADQKKVDPNADVNSYLKSWKIPENEFTKEKKISLKHLLSHSAGLTVHGFWGYYPGLEVPTLVQVLNGEAPANSDPIVVNKMPGESFRYSGGGYCVMQQMVIDVEQKNYPAAMKELVLDPLGMKYSTYQQPLAPDQLVMAATGYLPDGTMTRGRRHTYPEMAAAGLWTTAEDLAKFAIDIQQTLQGKSEKVLSQARATEMLTPFVETYTGLGIFLNNKGDEVYFGHGGWDEGFSAEMVAHKDKGYGVVILTNSNHPAFISELIRAVALTYNWENYVRQYELMKISAAEMAEVSGRYRKSSDNVIKVFEEENKLYLQNMGKSPAELFKIDEYTFVNRTDENYFRFEKKEGGEWELMIMKAGEKTVMSTHPIMAAGEKIPFEYLEAGDFDEALVKYKALLAKDPNDKAISEDNLNNIGYFLIRQKKMKLARDLFKINMLLYPKSFNTYDSYAEACMHLEDFELAIDNYNKSLQLNPMNNNATEMIKEIRKKQAAGMD